MVRFRDLTANLALAKTDSPPQKTPGTGDDYYSKSAFGYRSNFWELRGTYQTIGTRFNDERGFVPRTGVNNGEHYAGTHIRSKKFPSWVRETSPHIQFENYVGRNGSGLQSQCVDWHLPVSFQNSTFVEIGIHPNIEVLEKPFVINSRRGFRRTCATATANFTTATSGATSSAARSA